VKKDLLELCEDISVHAPGMWENELTPIMKDWFAVSTPDEGIIAYFFKESQAFHFRLTLINNILNQL
jgi:hypothetical protein